MDGSRHSQPVAALALVAILLIGSMAGEGRQIAQAATAGTAPFDSAGRHTIEPFLAAHCLHCHGAKESAAGVRLDTLPFEVTSVETAERWQDVLDVLNSGEMPPEERPRPDETVKAEVLAVLSRAMVTARAVIGDAGRVSLVRRLNRREYRHTLRDLLGIDIDAAGVDTSGLPDDTGTAAFDTIGSGLFMSSDQFEQYLAIGRAAIEAAASDWPRPGDPTPERNSGRREVEGDARKKIEGLLNGYHFLTGYRKAKEWEASGGRPASEFGFPDEHEARFRILAYETHGPYLERFLKLPHSESGAYLMYQTNNYHDHELITVPHEAAAGDYVLRVRIGATAEAPTLRRFLEFGLQPAKGDDEQSDFRSLGTFHVTGTIAQPQTIEIPVRVTANGPRTWRVREKRFHDGKADGFRNALAKAANGVGLDHALWIDWVEWEGPLPQSSLSPIRRQVFDGLAKKAPEDVLVKTILRRFGKLAFRGATPSPEFLDRLVAVYESKRQAGAPPIEAIREPMAVILASPGFLYLADPTAKPGDDEQSSGDTVESRRLSARELATRLSYFLWSAPPDKKLLSLVATNSLSKPDVLASQVDRLLADDRSHDFAAGFVHQWLGLDRLDFFRFDHELFPDFDEATRTAAKREVYETFHALVSGNIDARKLLLSDFVVVNGLMAAYYGLDDGGSPVVGDDFRIVKLPANSPRGGLLGMAAILAMGSNGERTSPVERGAWVLRKLMNDPPPPAPPNIPQLTRLEGQQITTRERLRMHQEQAQCAQCHRVIDPIGFGLENFDAAGRWRAEEHFYGRDWVVEGKLAGKVVRKSWPIDPSGAFYGGPSFGDFFELRREIAARHGNAFVRGLIENLYAYALGRPVSFADADTIDALVAQAKADGYRLRDVLHAIVSTSEFQTK